MHRQALGMDLPSVLDRGWRHLLQVRTGWDSALQIDRTPPRRGKCP